ncbi:MAG TPA: DegT/DnrJ/EryC1/StrS family aminotransferase [Geminicoccaceae bacterium]|nr:DegT/DnrJ/EryC1/StrS family aminotransferase [Geminicoccaceae bacterium]
MAPPSRPSLPFVDLQAQRRRLGGRIEAAIAAVLRHGQFVMGPEVEQLERALAEYVGVRHAVTCASGTDALLLVLKARGIGPGDAVFVPGFTFAASAEAVVLVGATPVFVDVDPASCNLDPASLEDALAAVERAGELRPRAVIAVDLFGRPADYQALRPVARARRLFVLQDAAQSFGARWCGAPAGGQGDAAATSFYPAKPLGAYGDGGAVLTDDDPLAEEVQLLRLHGERREAARYEHVRVGLNSRLDTLQAAILLAKLGSLDGEIERRATLARRYDEALGDLALPGALPGARSAWAQYTIRVGARDWLAVELRRRGIPTAVYYPRPLHRQPAYRHFPTAPQGLPIAEALARTVLSLPIHPDLEDSDQARVIAAIRDLVARKGLIPSGGDSK